MTSLFSRQEYRLPRTKRRGGLLRLSSYTRSSVDPKLPTSLESAHCPGFLESEQSRYIPRASQCGVLSAQAKAARAAQNGCGLGYSDPAKVRIVLYCDAVTSDHDQRLFPQSSSASSVAPESPLHCGILARSLSA